jgi:cation transport ATPase
MRPSSSSKSKSKLKMAVEENEKLEKLIKEKAAKKFQKMTGERISRKEYIIEFLKYTVSLSFILSILYISFFGKEVFGKGAVYSRVVSIYIFSVLLFFFLNKVIEMKPADMFRKTMMFFLVLVAITFAYFIITWIMGNDFSGLKGFGLFIGLAFLFILLAQFVHL